MPFCTNCGHENPEGVTSAANVARRWFLVQPGPRPREGADRRHDQGDTRDG